MDLVFVETHGFTAALPEYFANDESYRAFQDYLLHNPTAGSVMRGCGGLRKIRNSLARLKAWQRQARRLALDLFVFSGFSHARPGGRV